MPVARGRIQLVQEQRFRLRTDSGHSLLLRLAHNAPVESDDLHEFARRGQRVVVEYTGEPGLASGVAHAVRLETSS